MKDSGKNKHKNKNDQKKVKQIKAKKLICYLLKILKNEKKVEIKMEQIEPNLFAVKVECDANVLEKYFVKKDELEKIQKALVILGDQISKIDEKSEKLRDEINEAKNEAQNAKNESAAKDIKIQTLKDENKEKDKEKAEKDKEIQSLQNEKINTDKEIKDLKDQLNLDLYYQYLNLSADFRKNFTYIKTDSIQNFLITSGNKANINNLYEQIKNKAKNREDIKELSSFFDSLFSAYKDLYDLERLKSSDKELNENDHIDLNSKSRGEIAEMIFTGYKDGKAIYKSIVKTK